MAADGKDRGKDHGKDRRPPGEAEPPRQGPETDEVLDVGQEEVFSRAEVELGRIEHSHNGGGDRKKPGA